MSQGLFWAVSTKPHETCETRPETTIDSIGRASFVYPVTFTTTVILISCCRATTRRRQTKRWCGTTDINCSGVVCECLFGRSVSVFVYVHVCQCMLGSYVE
ncbi:hypothetical protein LOAG_07299 [Loa loa]|uniref:Uncharacterized protein n=1 Tax=Loa loa TaxID=7209 RepID=A0A1S0TWB8_LOALO|nr:hypothetical protein LOAG_07299 [Loa loa]EFO21190.1 hypothetical protein LOAG_07299 [Loa loa]